MVAFPYGAAVERIGMTVAVLLMTTISALELVTTLAAARSEAETTGTLEVTATGTAVSV